jgi:CheY-like chemotaxis protein
MDKKKILVVEDEKDIQKYLVTLFQDNGYDVVFADNGKQGMELAIKENPDLITLDLAMPEQTGVRTYRRFKDETSPTKDTPVIVITGVGEAMETFFHRLKGFSDPEGFINKPIDEKELIEKVTTLLAK